MSRFSRHYSVVFVEEPILDATEDHLEVTMPLDNLQVVVPHLRAGLKADETELVQKALLSKLFIDQGIVDYIFWYYTPMMLSISDHFVPALTVYDCVDELSALKFAPRELRAIEDLLFQKADLVFTGGYSLYEAKKTRHPSVYPFPSSIDVEHYFKARIYMADPSDQSDIPHPRIGYFGAIDERIDVALIEEVARRKFDWQFIMLGPVVKISPSALPKLPNIHYLGMKQYDELPAYIAGWDIAMMPFAHNGSTRYMSPTKTPEYLAAGKPVISTPIIDVIRQYGRDALVNIAGTPDEFIRVATLELETTDRDEWLQHVNEFLSQNSWDKTWQRMMYLITKKLSSPRKKDKAVTAQQALV